MPLFFSANSKTISSIQMGDFFVVADTGSLRVSFLQKRLKQGSEPKKTGISEIEPWPKKVTFREKSSIRNLCLLNCNFEIFSSSLRRILLDLSIMCR